MPSTSGNIFWLSISRALGLLILFFAYTQLFSYLGPFGTGQYQFVLSLITLFGVVVDLGIAQYVTKKIAEDTTSAQKYFKAFFSAEVVLASLVYASLILFVYLRGSEPVIFHSVLVAGLGLFFYGLSVPFLSVMSAFQDLRKVAIINFLAPIVNSVIIFSAIHFGLGIVFLSSHQLIFGLISIALYIRFAGKYIPTSVVFGVFRSVDFTLLGKILKAGVPFALLASFAVIYNRIDIVLITKILGYENTGLYTAAYKLVDLANFFPAAVSHSLYPVLTGFMARRATLSVKETLEKYLRFMILVAVPVGVLGSLFSKNLMLILTSGDQRFLPSSDVLAVLSWAIAILFIYIPVNSLVVSQLTKRAVYVTGTNVLVNVLGNLVLLPVYGIRAAAFMTVFSESLQAVFYFTFARKNLVKFEFFSALVKAGLAGIIMAGGLWKIKNFEIFPVPAGPGLQVLPSLIGNTVVLASVGVVIYLTFLVVFKYFTKEDLDFIKSKFVR